MSLINPIIASNADRIINKPVEKVIIIIDDDNYNTEAGYIEEGSIKIKFPANSVKLLDKSELQLGYNFSMEIKALQFYSLYEYEKLKNKYCTLNLHPLNIYIKNVRINISGEITLGENKAPIIITASKHVNNIREVIDGNPWGNLIFPWEVEITPSINVNQDTLGIENLL